MSEQPPAARRRPLSLRHLLSFETLLSLLNSIGTLWIFALMIVISIDVIGRTAFNSPLPGVLELVRLSIVGIVFIQLGHTLRAGRITRSDNLIRILQRRLPRASASACRRCSSSPAPASSSCCSRRACRYFSAPGRRANMLGIEGYITYPIWPVRLVILIGSACAGLQFLLFAWRDLKTVWSGRPPADGRRRVRRKPRLRGGGLLR